MTDAAPATSSHVPKQGIARVKTVLSGDTVVLVGNPTGPNRPAPEILFSLQAITAPRLAGKTTVVDEPAAFASREWLRQAVIGKPVAFTTLGGTPDNARVYGILELKQHPSEWQTSNVNHEIVRAGWANVKPSVLEANSNKNEAEEDPYLVQLVAALREAQTAARGLHANTTLLVRNIRQAGQEFDTKTLVQATRNQQVQCIVEHVLDGARLRCQIIDTLIPETYLYTHFTLLIAGINTPRKTPESSTQEQLLSDQAKHFTTLRLLQRQVPITLLGTDKSGNAAIGIVHHPAGNIAVELLKHGLARTSDWSLRELPVAHIPALQHAEQQAVQQRVGVWKDYVAPQLSQKHLEGMVIEVLSGDTLVLLPNGKAYQSEDDLIKISLASTRAPRMGTVARPEDEPYALEAKERMRVLTVGKTVQVTLQYEREIPLNPQSNEKRSFGTVSVGNKHPDVAETLIRDGLAVTQRHRDDDEKSDRYAELLAAEAAAKAAKKNIHAEKEYKRRGAVNDLTEARKAKAYSGSLMRAGNLKAVVDFCFNGALMKLYIPSENCYIRFAPSMVRCPQPSPSPGSKTGKPAEPFGDEAKRYARLHLLQRQVEINCTGVTNSGIINGDMKVGNNDFAIELLGTGLATLDQRKVEYGEVPRYLLDAEETARQNKVGIWSVEVPKQETAKATAPVAAKMRDTQIKIQLSEIRSGSHFFYHIVNDESAKVITDSMKLFTKNNGTMGAPCDAKVNKVVAALFDDGTGQSWYRAKILEKKAPTKATILYVDHGNVATVPIATHLRPLDMSLGTDRIPPIAREAVLALTITRPLDSEEGVDAAKFFQSLCWGKNLTARTFAPDESGRMTVELFVEGSDESVNAQLVSEGLARVAKQSTIDTLKNRMVDDTGVVKLAAELHVAQEIAYKSRSGMWRYGDVGDDDDDEI